MIDVQEAKPEFIRMEERTVQSRLVSLMLCSHLFAVCTSFSKDDLVCSPVGIFLSLLRVDGVLLTPHDAAC